MSLTSVIGISVAAVATAAALCWVVVAFAARRVRAAGERDIDEAPLDVD